MVIHFLHTQVEIKKAEVRKNGGGMGGNVNNSAMMAYAGDVIQIASFNFYCRFFIF